MKNKACHKPMKKTFYQNAKVKFIFSAINQTDRPKRCTTG